MRRWRRNTKQGDVGERKNDITLGDLIADVRRQLSDKGSRIAEDPVPFQLAWWLTSPTAMEQHVQELHSEYGQPSGPKTLNEEFFAEVRAIQDVLKNSFPLTKTGDELVDAGSEVEEGMNRRARAMSLWEQIAFPLRRYGDIIFRVRAPRDISGNPIIEAALTDDFIRGVSTHTAKDKVEIARLQKRLSLWKLIAAGASVVAALLLSRAVLS